MLQSLDKAAVHLAHTTFTEVQRGTNLFHRELFIVIQNNDEPFIAVKAFGH